jgi:acyl-CoA synthetase (AMP-forming)/AMP-acid ligase II/acetyltransferase-like isoleucine patch superfamily enzyme/acyl carrier protein
METTVAPSPPRQSDQGPAGSLHQLVRERTDRSADALAFLAPGRRSLTYGRLFEQVERTARALRGFGVHRNERVAMVLPNGPEMAAAFAGVAAAAACAPLNPTYRAGEFEFYLSDLKARLLIVPASADSPARAVAAKLGIAVVELVRHGDAEAGIFDLVGDGAGRAASEGLAEPQDTALVLHTSGTTSRPKIVPLTHANICSSGRSIAATLELTPADRCLNVMPLFHIHGLVGAIASSLAAGASTVCAPGPDPDAFFDWLDAFAPTWYTAVPTMHQAILGRAAAHRERVARRRLRLIRSSSAALPPRVLAALEETFAAPVIEAYGMTEAAHQVASNPLRLPRKPGSVGLAAGPEVAIMGESGELLPAGQAGEVVIRGASVTAGYEGDPAANRQALTKGWFRTGDQGRIDADGYLFLTGRLKEIINRGGEKIAPREVDDLLLQHPAIAEAIAFGVPHATLGEDIAAAVVPRAGANLTEGEVRGFLAARLADFKVPGRIAIVAAIPKGPTGKLQRKAVAEQLKPALEGMFVAPATPIEAQVAEVWTEVLGLGRVGVRDHFQAVGGDSLSMATMLTGLAARFGREIAIDRFLESPTIETIARLLQESGSPAAIPAPAAGAAPIRDSALAGARNRLLQVLALYAPGYKTTRVWLHRRRGVAIGRNTSIGLSVIIETAYPRLVSIGSNVTLGMRSIIIAHFRDLTAHTRATGRPTVRIEDDVYVGPGVIVLPNVTIGQGAVVSAGSVVSSSVPPRTLVRGNPARPIARCGVSLGGDVSYEEFLRHLTPLGEDRRP